MILDTKGNKFNNEKNNFETKMDSIKNNAQIVDEANLNPFVEDVNSMSYSDATNTANMKNKSLSMLNERLKAGLITTEQFHQEVNKLNKKYK